MSQIGFISVMMYVALKIRLFGPKKHQDEDTDRFRKKYYDLERLFLIVFQPPTSGNSHSRWMKKFHDYDSILHFQPRMLITIPSVEFLEKIPPLVVWCCETRGGIFSKQHQILKIFRAFGADFDPIYTVIIPLNDVFGVVARRRRFF